MNKRDRLLAAIKAAEVPLQDIDIMSRPDDLAAARAAYTAACDAWAAYFERHGGRRYISPSGGKAARSAAKLLR